MANLYKRITDDLTAAMKDKRADEVGTLRLLTAAVKNKQIAVGEREDAKDELVIEVVQSELKKRRDSIEAYTAGNRPELAAHESAEVLILKRYVPAQLGEAEIEAAVRAVIAAQPAPVTMAAFGQVMGQTMAKLKGQADGNAVSAAVKRILQS